MVRHWSYWVLICANYPCHLDRTGLNTVPIYFNITEEVCARYLTVYRLYISMYGLYGLYGLYISCIYSPILYETWGVFIPSPSRYLDNDKIVIVAFCGFD